MPNTKQESAKFNLEQRRDALIGKFCAEKGIEPAEFKRQMMGATVNGRYLDKLEKQLGKK